MTTLAAEQALDFSTKAKRMRLDNDADSPSLTGSSCGGLLHSPAEQPTSTTTLPATPPMSTASLLSLSGLLGHSDSHSAFAPLNTSAGGGVGFNIQQLLLGLTGGHSLLAPAASGAGSLLSAAQPTPATTVANASLGLFGNTGPLTATTTAAVRPDLPAGATDPTITAQALQSMQRRRKRAAQMGDKSASAIRQSSMSPGKLALPPSQLLPGSPDTTPSKQQQQADNVSTTSDGGNVVKDAAYWERRRKNNSAAKRSRDQRRQKEEQVAARAAFLEQENLKLRAQVNVLKNETAKLQFLLFNNPSALSGGGSMGSMGSVVDVGSQPRDGGSSKHASPVGSTGASSHDHADTLSPVLTD